MIRATQVATRLTMVAASDPGLALLAGVSLVSALVFSVVVWPFTWSADLDRNLRAAAAIRDGSFGVVDGYLYSPLAAILTVPLLALPTGVAAVAWIAAKVSIVAGAVAVATRGVRPDRRFYLGVGAIAFLPVVDDLLLGNVTIALFLCVALVAWRSDRFATGIALGLALATVPKPVLVPILVWMLVARRRALVAALATAAAAIAVTLAFTGPAPWIAWIAALRAPPILAGGNLAVSAWPPALAIAAAAAVVALTALAIRRGETPGLIAALCCGLLVSTYTVLYGAALVLAGAPALIRAAPGPTLALALVAPIGLIVAFPAWVLAMLVLALVVPRDRWPQAGTVDQ